RHPLRHGLQRGVHLLRQRGQLLPARRVDPLPEVRLRLPHLPADLVAQIDPGPLHLTAQPQLPTPRGRTSVGDELITALPQLPCLRLTRPQRPLVGGQLHPLLGQRARQRTQGVGLTQHRRAAHPLAKARPVLAPPPIAARPASSSCAAAGSSATPASSRSMAAACALGALAASSNSRAETGWNGQSANRGACSASNRLLASRICRQPRNWSVFDSANTTVSTRSANIVRKRSSGMVNGAEASTTNSSAVAPAAASIASSPCAESSPPTPGVSTTLMRSRSGTGPLTST